MSVQSVLLLVFAVLRTTEGDYVNGLDQPFTFTCLANQTIGRIHSVHSNGAEDRQFDLTCQDVLPDFEDVIPICYWTDFVNGYDEAVHFSCPTNNYINGMSSVHSNHAEDRVFKFHCCETPLVHMVDCDFSGWTNDYDKPSDFSIDDGKVLKGMISVHSNRQEDRLFDFESCKVKRFSEPVEPIITG